MTPLARFLAKVDQRPHGGCWLWTAYTKAGYGRFWDGERAVSAHRWAYETWVGPIPEGLQIDHICRVRACVNPAHLRAVDHLTNQRNSDVTNLVRTTCRQGHPLEGDNLYTYTGEDGYTRRYCRRCRADEAARRRAREMTSV